MFWCPYSDQISLVNVNTSNSSGTATVVVVRWITGEKNNLSSYLCACAVQTLDFAFLGGMNDSWGSDYF